MQYVADALADDPRDVASLRQVVPTIRPLGELFVDSSDDAAQIMLMRTPTEWTRLVLFNPPVTAVPWFGQRLTHLDIRSDEPIGLWFTEFLPNLTHFCAMAPRFTSGVRAPVPKLKSLRLITSSMFGLFSNTDAVLPELEVLEIHTTFLHAVMGVRFPPKLRSLHLSGMLVRFVVDALSTCNAKDVTLVGTGLLDVPDLSPELERLDVSHNMIGSFGSDRYPKLRELNVQNNFLFDSTTIMGDALEVLDIRGTCSWPFHLPAVHTIYTDVDPPTDMIVACPNLRRVIVKDVDSTQHPWNMKEEMMIVERPREDPGPSDTCEWTSFVDDVAVVHRFRRYDRDGGIAVTD